MINAGILTISDKGSRGERQDLSGPVVREILGGIGARVIKYEIVPDEMEVISARLAEWADGGEMDIILTSGGTGLAARDVTPEATWTVIDRGVPGIAEAMRAKSMEKTPMAMLSRAEAGLRGVGMDTISPDPVDSKELPVHSIFLGAGMIIIENLTNQLLRDVHVGQDTCKAAILIDNASDGGVLLAQLGQKIQHRQGIWQHQQRMNHVA